jgi:hypothetical protein
MEGCAEYHGMSQPMKSRYRTLSSHDVWGSVPGEPTLRLAEDSEGDATRV